MKNHIISTLIFFIFLSVTQLAFSAETGTMTIRNMAGGGCKIPPNELTVISDNNAKAKVDKNYQFKIPQGAKAIEVIGESSTCATELCSNTCIKKGKEQNPEDAADCKECSNLCSEVTLGGEPAVSGETINIPCD